MIFKDEGSRIARAIRSAKSLLGAYELSDTGSTDDSLVHAHAALHGVPGAVNQDKWVNFSHNRNLVLERARKHGLPILFLDCDDDIFFGEPEHLGDWDVLTTWAFDGPLRHRRVLAVGPNLPVFWEGVLHERLTWDSVVVPKFRHSTYINLRYLHDGARYLGGRSTTEADASLLRSVPEHDASYIRSQYYLARTLHHDGQVEMAMRAYERYLSASQIRDETTFHSYLSLAALSETKGASNSTVMRYLALAKTSRPQRIEPMLISARILREAGNANQALDECLHALSHANVPADDFVDLSYYGWRLYDELATSALLAGHHDLGRAAIAKALSAPYLPDHHRTRILSNLSLLD